MSKSALLPSFDFIDNFDGVVLIVAVDTLMPYRVLRHGLQSLGSSCPSRTSRAPLSRSRHLRLESAGTIAGRIELKIPRSTLDGFLGLPLRRFGTTSSAM